MKYLLCFSFTITSFFIYGQYMVSYDITSQFSYIPNKSTGKLFINEDESIFEFYEKELDKKTAYINENEELDGIYINKAKQVHKVYTSGIMYSNSNIKYMKSKIIIDTLNLFNWETHNETKEILGYTCNKAITNFRGRNYIAWYTDDIKYNDGPWKFYGLPGLILSIECEDEKIAFHASKIEPYKDLIPTSRVKEDNGLSWSRAIKEAKNKYQFIKKRIEEKYNSSVHVKFNSTIEKYDLNVDKINPFTAKYEVMVTLKEYVNNKEELHKTIPTSFSLSEKEFISSYKYLEKITNSQGATEFGMVTSKGFLFKNFLKNEYKNTKNLFNRTYLIEDKILDYKWQIFYNKTKNIKGYKATLATTILNDIKIKAWYTTDIISINGPDNYHGLPGLIIELEEIRDSENTREIKKYDLLSVSYDNKVNINQPKEGIKTTVKEFEELYKEAFKNFYEMNSQGVDTSD